jgi:hypothetical protein
MTDMYALMQTMMKQMSAMGVQVQRLTDEQEQMKRQRPTTTNSPAPSMKEEVKPSSSSSSDPVSVTPATVVKKQLKKETQPVTPTVLFGGGDDHGAGGDRNKSRQSTGSKFDDDVGDEEIMESESDDDCHEYSSYVEWLVKREKLYPYKDEKHKKKYANRCTLLSHNGRVNEYYRFGLRVDFDRRLYPSGYTRWYTRYMDTMQKGTSDLRSTDIRTLTVPSFYYDDREVRLRTRSNDDCDLSPYAVTLSMLPSELQDNPSTQSAYYMSPPSLKAVVDRHFYHNKLRAAAAAPPVDSRHASSSSSDSMNIKSQPNSSGYDSMMKQNQYSYSGYDSMTKQNHSSSSSDSMSNKSQSSYSGYDSMTKQNHSSSSSDSMNNKSQTISRLTTVKREPIQGDVNSHTSGAAGRAPSQAVEHPHLSPSDEMKYFGAVSARPSEAYEQPETRIHLVKQEQEEYDSRRQDSDYHVKMRTENVLGDVINMFDQGTRAILELTRSTRPMTPAEINKAVSTTAHNLNDFDGDPEKAPARYEYCSCIVPETILTTQG